MANGNGNNAAVSARSVPGRIAAVAPGASAPLRSGGSAPRPRGRGAVPAPLRGVRCADRLKRIQLRGCCGLYNSPARPSRVVQSAQLSALDSCPGLMSCAADTAAEPEGVSCFLCALAVPRSAVRWGGSPAPPSALPQFSARHTVTTIPQLHQIRIW